MASIDRRFLDVRLVVDGFSTGETCVVSREQDGVQVNVTQIKIIKGYATDSEEEKYIDLEEGAQFVVAQAASHGVFAGQNVNDLAMYNGGGDEPDLTWKFVMPGNTEIFDKVDNKFWRYNGTKFVEIMSLPTSEGLQKLADDLGAANEDMEQMKEEMLDILDNADELLGDEITEAFTLNNVDVVTKRIVLSKTIKQGKESQVRVFLNGLTHIYGVDYTAGTTNNISYVKWDTLTFDGLLSVGDVLLVSYPYIVDKT